MTGKSGNAGSFDRVESGTVAEEAVFKLLLVLILLLRPLGEGPRFCCLDDVETVSLTTTEDGAVSGGGQANRINNRSSSVVQ